jgi:tyrosinase
MRLRKSVTSLTAKEKAAFVQALLELKRRGEYDKYVHWHHHVMIPTVLSHEPRDAEFRNGAHRGPAFLPWHREFLMQLEGELRTIDGGITIPYWDWVADSALEHPETASIWGADFMGGNGLESDQWRVQTGPFAYNAGKWPVPAYPEEELPGPGLKRRFGNIVPTLPTNEDRTLALNEIFYDTPNYDRSPFTIGFRNRLEGWVTQRGDARVRFPSSQLHNRVHLWVGGNMVPMTSPDDPVFFLHHCFIDKLWADWQVKQKEERPEAAPHYAPEQQGPPGHNLHDQLKPWKRTVAEVLDTAKLGYEYEQPAPTPELLRAAAAVPVAVPPAAPMSASAVRAIPRHVRRSPFFAE